MGYSTCLYAIDVSQLRSAVGSNDRKLIQRAKRAKTPRLSAPDRVRSPDVIHVMYGLNGDIFHNGEKIGIAEISAIFARVGPKGVFAFCNEHHPKGYWPPAQKAVGRAVEDAAFKSNIRKFLPCLSEKELATRQWPEDDIQFEKKAVVELVSGKELRLDYSYYGYALERLCQVIGERLKDCEFGKLSDLKIDTPLATWSSPILLPTMDDFPFISYLASEEVISEVERLKTLELFSEEMPEIAHERNLYFRTLDRVRAKGLGVVAFYY